MANRPLDLSQYARNPLSLLSQLGANPSPSFVTGDEDQDQDQNAGRREDLADEYESTQNSYPPLVGPSATASAAPRQKSTAELRSQQDYDTLRASLANAPKEVAPKWWQSVAAGVAGAGAGWSNAAGRSRNPIDIAQMTDEINHPGYRQRMAEWQSRVAPQQKVADLDRAQSDQERKDRQLDIQENWNKARAEAEHQRGVMWAARARAYDHGKITGKIASTPEERAAIADKYQFPPDMKQYYIANSNLTGYGATLANPGKAGDAFNLSPGMQHWEGGKMIAENPKVVDPSAQSSRELAQELQRQRLLENQQRMSGSIEKAKADTEDKIRKEREGLIKQLLARYGRNSEGDLGTIKDSEHRASALAAVQAINKSLASRLQAAQDQYARSIRQGGGTADDYDVDPLTLASALRKPK